jgi:ABC-type antimicrobial peptide transport system permease subunit
VAWSGDFPFKWLSLAGDVRDGVGFLWVLLQRLDRLGSGKYFTAGDPHQYVTPLRAMVQKLDPSLPLTDVETMNEHLGFALYPARMGASLLSLFGGLGLLLAVLGLYGVVSFVVRRRTRKIGIRIALGAQKHDVVSIVIRQGVWLVGLGMALGIAAAFAATQLVAGMPYGVAGRDVLTFTAASLLLACVSILATYIPAGQAARVDPMVALRYE